MKKSLILLISFFIVVSVNAQKNFQGEITYRLHVSNEEKADAELKILFGVNKLKLRFKEKEDYDKEGLIVVFDSAAIFIVNKETKTYTRKPLHTNAPAKHFSKKSFAGYSSTPLIQESNGLGNILGGMMGTSDIVFYLSDSLYYNIPAAFVGNQELIAIQKNKIVLGAEININSPYKELQDSSSNQTNLITVEAVEIKPMIINEDEFTIPADYVDRKSSDYSPAEDSVAVSAPEIDTVAVAPPTARKTVPKKPVKSNKSKTAVKSSAVKRKE
ncbi:MAG: hypothetical protein ABI666_02750 [Ferruginibacter sp.]